jgi:RNA polymerase sigma-70 factor (ECF subfamily)
LAATVDAVYQRFFPVIREKCRSMLRDSDDAQDVAQETFVRLWQSRLDLEDPKRVAAWVYRTATHLAVDRIRRNARGAEVRGVEADAPAPAGDARVHTRQLLERLAGKIPADELELAFLDRVDGLTQPESAQVLGVSERTVRRMLVRLDERLSAFKAEVSP